MDRPFRRRLPAGLDVRSGSMALGCLLVIVFLVPGCMNIQVLEGNRPNVEALESSLRVGESTQTDVLRVLGQPYGKGAAMLPVDPKPRTMWSYYYTEATLEESKLIFLFVFFDQTRYDGYLWFSDFGKR
jgi:hypothetical protein